jgi:hypothetical protein
MPFYLKHVPYATWHVYSVEAQDEDEAHQDGGRSQYWIAAEVISCKV